MAQHKCTKFVQAIVLDFLNIPSKLDRDCSLHSPVKRKTVFRYAGPYLEMYLTHRIQILRVDSFHLFL